MLYIQIINISNKHKLLVIDTSLISSFTLLFIVNHIIYIIHHLNFARFEVLIRKTIIRISFYRRFKNEMTYKPSRYIY